MNLQTLLVIAKDKHSYEKWVNKFGTRLKNIQFHYANNPEDLLGWSGENTYYTIINGDNIKKMPLREAAFDSPFKYVPQENFEERVKKLPGPKGPQD